MQVFLRFALTALSALVLVLSLGGKPSNIVKASSSSPMDRETQISFSYRPKVVSRCFSPPAGFNPFTATPSAIAYYGLPQKPRDAKGIGIWSNLVKYTKHQDCGPNQPLLHPVYHNLPLRTKPSTQPSGHSPNNIVNDSSGNWSGIFDSRQTSDGVRFSLKTTQPM
jgi:hypothetical protein